MFQKLTGSNFLNLAEEIRARLGIGPFDHPPSPNYTAFALPLE
jgi:hypothetical protein